MRYLFLLICCQYGLAQDTLVDSFSDGNMTIALEWKSDTSSFIVNNLFQLQLQAEPNMSPQQLFIHSEIVDTGQWSFFHEMLFNPSGQNYTEVVLINPDTLFGNTQKFSLELGRLQDKITVQAFNNGVSTLIFESDQTIFTGNTNKIWCKVTHLEGVWSIDYTLDSLNWISLPSFTYSTQATSTFGIICHYTSSRKDKFIFDDIVISGYPFQDIYPPYLVSDSVLDYSNIQLIFSEPIDSMSVLLNSNIFFEHTASVVSQLKWITKSILQLTVDTLNYNTPYRLHINSITDLNSNAITDTSLFYYFQHVFPYDLEVTELMIDPSPPVYLPEVEYIELKNSAAYPINLNTCLVQVGDKYYNLPTYTLLPEELAVIYPSSARLLIDSTAKTLFLPTSFSLPNTNGLIQILDSGFQTIHSVHYSNSWYNNPNKQDGGWSIEQTYLHYPCLQGINWQASSNTNGGSPGEYQNKYSPYFNLNKLQPTGFAHSDTSLLLRFPYSILGKNFLNPDYYTSNIELKSITKINAFELEITFKVPLANQTVYTIELSDQLQPCFTIDWKTIYFGLTSKPQNGVLVSSEILFDTDGDHSEFIEYKNISSSNLDIYDFALNVIKDSTESTINCSNTHQIIPPGAYLILAKNLEHIFFYYNKFPGAVYIEIDNWISLDDKSGEIHLLNRSHEIIDSSCYNALWHSIDLESVENVSLEKIELTYPPCYSTSWASASEPEGFATPGFVNSQHLQFTTQSTPIKSFSPNNDGINDLWIYTMYFSSPENKVDASVYDLNGYKQFTYSTGLLAGTSHTFIWNGQSDNGDILPIGTYIFAIRNRTHNTIDKFAISITDE